MPHWGSISFKYNWHVPCSFSKWKYLTEQVICSWLTAQGMKSSMSLSCHTALFLNTKALTIKLPEIWMRHKHIFDVSKSSTKAHPCIAWLHIPFWVLQKHGSWSEGKRGAKHLFPAWDVAANCVQKCTSCFATAVLLKQSNCLPFVSPKTKCSKYCGCRQYSWQELKGRSTKDYGTWIYQLRALAGF